jgi:hypothetical protein
VNLVESDQIMYAIKQHRPKLITILMSESHIKNKISSWNLKSALNHLHSVQYLGLLLTIWKLIFTKVAPNFTSNHCLFYFFCNCFLLYEQEWMSGVNNYRNSMHAFVHFIGTSVWLMIIMLKCIYRSWCCCSIIQLPW